MKDFDPLRTARRIADEAIYLKEERYEEPKEAFKLLGRMIGAHVLPAEPRVLDAGCATGELLFYLRKVFPEARLAGLDVSQSLLDRCADTLPGVQLYQGSIADTTAAPAATFDVVTMSGVLCCLDDPAPALDAALSWLAAGGLLLVFDAFNSHPVDVIMRYRRADLMENDEQAPWETGWNVFSRHNVDRLLASRNDVVSWDYTPFELPFSLEPKHDPMRTWTIRTEESPYQLVNGALQLVNLSILRIVKVPN